MTEVTTFLSNNDDISVNPRTEYPRSYRMYGLGYGGSSGASNFNSFRRVQFQQTEQHGGSMTAGPVAQTLTSLNNKFKV